MSCWAGDSRAESPLGRADRPLGCVGMGEDAAP